MQKSIYKSFFLVIIILANFAQAESRLWKNDEFVKLCESSLELADCDIEKLMGNRKPYLEKDIELSSLRLLKMSDNDFRISRRKRD